MPFPNSKIDCLELYVEDYGKSVVNITTNTYQCVLIADKCMLLHSYDSQHTRGNADVINVTSATSFRDTTFRY